MPASTILLLETDPAADDTIAPDPGRRPATRVDPDDRPGRGARTGGRPPAPDHRSSSARAALGDRDLRARSARRRRWPQVPVLCVSPTDDVEERIRFLEAGADDVMARPFDARELEARVEALLLRFQRSQGPRRRCSRPTA